jgi:hypothetical protein
VTVKEDEGREVYGVRTGKLATNLMKLKIPAVFRLFSKLFPMTHSTNMCKTNSAVEAYIVVAVKVSFVSQRLIMRHPAR